MMIQTFFLLLVLIIAAFSFNVRYHGNVHKRSSRNSLPLEMKWSISKRKGGGPIGMNFPEQKVVGQEGELYYHPSKIAKLKEVPTSRMRTVPLLPYNSNLAPHGNEWVHVFEMRYRQMMQDVGDGVFGFTYYSQQEQKLGLVGTLAKVKSRKFLEDGRLYVSLEGQSRFYINEVVSESPYLKAKITPFKDAEVKTNSLATLERIVFDEVRVNMKLMQIVFPQKNFSISERILESRPPYESPEGVRSVYLTDPVAEHDRRVRFSFAVFDMLQTSPATKLSLLQEPSLERRLGKLINVLEKGGAYLRNELKKQGYNG